MATCEYQMNTEEMLDYMFSEREGEFVSVLCGKPAKFKSWWWINPEHRHPEFHDDVCFKHKLYMEWIHFKLTFHRWNWNYGWGRVRYAYYLIAGWFKGYRWVDPNDHSKGRSRG